MHVELSSLSPAMHLDSPEDISSTLRFKEHLRSSAFDLYQDPSSLHSSNLFVYSRPVLQSRAIVINTQFISKPFAVESPQIESLDNVDDGGIARDRSNQVAVEHWVGRRHLQGRVDLRDVRDSHRYTSHPKSNKDHREGGSRLEERNLVGSEELNDEELSGEPLGYDTRRLLDFIPGSESPPKTSLSAQVGPVANPMSESCSGTLGKVR